MGEEHGRNNVDNQSGNRVNRAENQFADFKSAYDDLIKASETVVYSFPKQTDITETIPARKSSPGMMGYTPLPEQRIQLTAALQNKSTPRPTRYRIGEETVTHTVQSEEILSGVPRVQFVVFLHADINAFLSKDKQKKVLDQAARVLEICKALAGNNNQDITKTNMDFLVKSETVAGVHFTSNGLLSIGNFLTGEITRTLEIIKGRYEYAVSKVCDVPPGLSISDIKAHAFLGDSNSKDLQSLLIDRYTFPLRKIGSGAESYFPATMIFDIDSGSDEPKYTTMPGRIINRGKTSGSPVVKVQVDVPRGV